ncbi:hypothetical protein BGZ73_000541 [Actinomortierella ambigua]|nr:hypothetical protein BGZ73_000541 [Actinomortierella ambigua]
MIHIDGPPIKEKALAQEKRSAKATGADLCSESLAAFEASMEPDQQHPDGSLRSPSNLRRRLVRSFNRMMAAWKKAWRIDLQTRHRLARDLTALGHQAHVCEGEADSCIRRAAMSADKPIHVATADSDMLFVPNTRVLHQDPKHKANYWLYTMNEEALGLLGIPSFEVWLIMAITSGNDYSENIKGFGLVKNRKILCRLWEELDTTQRNAPQLLASYVAHMQITEPGRFDDAAKIFLDANETPLTPATTIPAATLLLGAAKRFPGELHKLNQRIKQDRAQALRGPSTPAALTLTTPPVGPSPSGLLVPAQHQPFSLLQTEARLNEHPRALRAPRVTRKLPQSSHPCVRKIVRPRGMTLIQDFPAITNDVTDDDDAIGTSKLAVLAGNDDGNAGGASKQPTSSDSDVITEDLASPVPVKPASKRRVCSTCKEPGHDKRYHE